MKRFYNKEEEGENLFTIDKNNDFEKRFKDLSLPPVKPKYFKKE